MISALISILEKERIDLYSILPFSACRVIKPYLLKSFQTPQSVLMVVVPYRNKKECKRLSKYAMAKDYHLYFENLWNQCISKLKKEYPQYEFVAFTDHSPIAEQEAAVRCGLGCRGDNGLLITKKYGSYVFLGEIFSTMPYCGDFKEENESCLHCNQCKMACPNQNQCLSAITQKKQELTFQEKALMVQHQSAWGCDICQDVCPMNAGASLSPIPFFNENLITEFTFEKISNMPDDVFSQYAFAWRGRACVLRNLQLLESCNKE